MLPKARGLDPARPEAWSSVEQVARHIVFFGQVQGVGFRYTAHRIAGRRGLTGFVRNLPDGTVEMLVQGPAGDIDLCLEEIDAEFAGQVRERRVRQVPPDPSHRDFRIAF